MSAPDQPSGNDPGEQRSDPHQTENGNNQSDDGSESFEILNTESNEVMKTGESKDNKEPKEGEMNDGEQVQMIPGNKYLIIQSGKTLNSHKTFLNRLNKRAPGLQEVDSEQECNFILVFCSIVSRAGTDIEAALNKLNQISETKFAVLVVLHHTFNPDQVVPDSRRAVSRKNTITADFLFYEDQGLLQCPKNEESLTSIIKHIKPQKTTQSWSFSFPSLLSVFATEEKKPEIKQNPKTGNKYFILYSGKTLNSHKTFLNHLNKRAPGLQEVDSEQECDFILVFCTVVSQPETDIEAALNKLNQISGTKPAAFVVLHHKYNPDQIVPDSKRWVRRQKTITVDCLFHEDQGLLDCQRNHKAIAEIIEWQKDVISPLVNSQSPVAKSALTPETKLQNSSHPQNRANSGHPVNANQSTQADTHDTTYLRANEECERTIKDLEKDKEILIMIKDVSELSFATELSLVLLGKAGPETAAAKNTILNQAGTSTSTQQNEIIQGKVHGRKIRVVETDLFQSEPRVHLTASGPRAFLLVLPLKNYVEMEERAEEENQKIIRTMEKLFGVTCWKNTMILFTVTDELQKKNSEEFIYSGNKLIQDLVEKCGNRFHCLNINETGDVSEVKELLEKIEKMVEGNADSGEIFKMLTDMEENREKLEKVRQEMQKTLKKLDEFIKGFESDLTEIDGQKEHTKKEWIEKVKSKYELEKSIGELLKIMYDRVAGMEEDRRFVRVILPETQQSLWLPVPNENHKQMNKDEELTKIYDLFMSKMSLKSSSDKQERENMKDESV